MPTPVSQVAPFRPNLMPSSVSSADGRALHRPAYLLQVVAAARRRNKRPAVPARSATSAALSQVSPAPESVAAACTSTRKPASEVVGEAHLRRLHALFHTCDSDEDGVLTASELVVLLRLIGASESDATAAALPSIDGATGGVDGDPGLSVRPVVGASFERVLNDCRDVVVACYEQRCVLPPRVFVARCRPLKRGFCNCDTDGSLVISRTELEIALQKLDLILGDDELDRVMALLDGNADGTIEWSEFLFAAWTSASGPASGTLQQYFNVDIFSDMPSFIRVGAESDGSARIRPLVSSSSSSAAGSHRSPALAVPAGYVSRIEHFGIRLLTRAAEARVSSAKRAGVALAVATGPLGPSQSPVQSASVRACGARHRRPGNGISDEERRAMARLEALAVLVGALAGVLFGLAAIGLDAAIFPASLDTDSAAYYAYALLLNVAVSLVEVHVLYSTALVSAFRLTVSANLVLFPLDREREFLTRAIARAALQAGNRKASLFGIDPMRGSPRLVAVATLLLYKTKRYALKFLLKLLIKRVLWRAAARTALSLLVLPVSALSNAWTLRRVMRHCRVNIIGPPCVLAVLEVFLLEDACVAPRQRVDYLRAIGCALVSKRAIHPNAEIMLQFLRHRWLCAELWPSAAGESDCGSCSCLTDAEAPCNAHPLDSTDELLASLERYGAVEPGESLAPDEPGLSARRHLRNVFFLLVVALIIDGSLGWAERKLFVRCCQAAGVPNHWSRVLRLKRAFVAGRGIDVDNVFALVEGTGDGGDARGRSGARGEDSAHVPVSEALQFVWNRLAGLLSC